MPVTVRIPTYLASFAGGRNSLGLEGSPETVSEALKMLWSLHPALRDRIVDEQGAVRQHINIFVGDEAIRFAEGLATKVPADAEIIDCAGGERRLDRYRSGMLAPSKTFVTVLRPTP